MTDQPEELYRVPRLLADHNGKAVFVEKVFQTPEELFRACFSYFEWVDQRPFKRMKHLVVSLGAGMGSEVQEVEETLPRMYTIYGLILYLGVVPKTYYDWKDPMSRYYWPAGANVLSWAETIIREQNLTLAGSGFLNPMLVMRMLGIREQLDVKTEDVSPDGQATTVDPKLMTKEERLLLYRAMKRNYEIQEDDILS